MCGGGGDEPMGGEPAVPLLTAHSAASLCGEHGHLPSSSRFPGPLLGLRGAGTYSDVISQARLYFLETFPALPGLNRGHCYVSLHLPVHPLCCYLSLAIIVLLKYS